MVTMKNRNAGSGAPSSAELADDDPPVERRWLAWRDANMHRWGDVDDVDDQTGALLREAWHAGYAAHRKVIDELVY